jgi:hypothetical protein
MSTFSLSFSGDAKSAMNGLGSKDGRGCADHDEPYRFGRRPRANAPFPFTPSQYARVLALRGCVGDGLLGHDDLNAPGQPLTPAEPSESEIPPCTACSSRPPDACTGCARDLAARAILRFAGVLDDNEVPN